MQAIILPHPNTYHVPGSRLLAGEYPFEKDTGAGLAKLRAFVRSGITYFLDLTEERDGLAPYADTLQAEAAAIGRIIVYHRLRVRDMDIPPRERMTEILDAIDAAEAAGHTVYVHCWGGVGRTGTVVGCYLVRRGATGDDALDHVAKLFETMSSDKVRRHRFTGSPQTGEQRAFVRHWREARS